MKKIISLVLLALLIPATAFAAPSVSGVSGTVDTGETVTISGSSFGSSGVPLSFLDFESGTVGNTFSESGWTPSADGGSTNYPRYANKDGHAKCVVANPLAADVKSAFSRSGSVNRYWYLTYDVWMMMGISNAWQGAKLWRVQTDPDNEPELIYVIEDGGYLSMLNCDGSQSYQEYPNETTGQWVRHELWLDAGAYSSTTASFVFNKIVQGSSVSATNGSGFQMLDCSGEGISYIKLGSELETGVQEWWDNVYVSNTRARVEIGNASTFAASTKREIQVPSSWSTGSITATINRGTFSAGSGAYLFVIDSTGAASSGYPITFGSGGGGDITAPVITITTIDGSANSSSNYSTSSSTVTLAGTATDAVGVTSVTWSNDRGGSGTTTCTGCTGTSVTWSQSNIALYSGDNVITISATDGTNTSTDVLTVTYTPVVEAPTVTSVSVNGAIATINFSETVVTTGYDTGDFNLDCTSPTLTDVALSSPSGTGASRTFTIATAIVYGQVCNLDYVGSTNDIEDTAGNDLVAFSNTAVTNNTPQVGGVEHSTSDVRGIVLRGVKR